MSTIFDERLALEYKSMISSLRNNKVGVISALNRHRYLNAVLRLITAIEHLKSVGFFVPGAIEDSDTIKITQKLCDELLNILNEKLDGSLQNPNVNVESLNPKESEKLVDENTSSNTR